MTLLIYAAVVVTGKVFTIAPYGGILLGSLPFNAFHSLLKFKIGLRNGLG